MFEKKKKVCIVFVIVTIELATSQFHIYASQRGGRWFLHSKIAPDQDGTDADVRRQKKKVCDFQ